MYGDDSFDLLSSLTSTTTDDNYTQTGNQTDTQTTYSPYSSSSYADDYSVQGNYQGQSSYETTNNYEEAQTTETYASTNYQIPTIAHEEQAVALTRTKQRIYLSTRLKLIVSCFAIIMASLVFVSAWNFISANQIKSQIALNETEISALETRISNLVDEYNMINDESYMHQQAIEAGYEDSSETNTFYLQADSASETTREYKLPSNWFNDVCEFLSSLFA